ncbi:MAG: acyltransferase [Cyanobacteria bacterium P01_D01_bin.56]
MFGLFRTLLASMIAVGHFGGPFEIGIYAVFGFYVLSGFLMTAAMHQRYGYGGSGQVKFLINRFLKLFPTYWIAILISIICLLVFGENFTAFKSELFMPNTFEAWLRNISLILARSFRPRLSPSTWQITVELFYYLIICFGISKYRRRSLVWLTVGLVYTIAAFLLEPTSWKPRFYPIFAASFPFSIGACIYHFKGFFNQALKAIKIKQPAVLFGLVCLNFLVFFELKKIAGVNLIFTVGFYLNLWLMILCIVALLANGFGFISRETDRFIGKFSYPIFLVHWQCGALINLVLPKNQGPDSIPLGGPLFLLLSIGLSILMSYLIVILIDDPVDKRRQAIKASIRLA